jgi:hypothetical protein
VHPHSPHRFGSSAGSILFDRRRWLDPALPAERLGMHWAFQQLQRCFPTLLVVQENEFIETLSLVQVVRFQR